MSRGDDIRGVEEWRAGTAEPAAGKSKLVKYLLVFVIVAVAIALAAWAIVTL